MALHSPHGQLSVQHQPIRARCRIHCCQQKYTPAPIAYEQQAPLFLSKARPTPQQQCTLVSQLSLDRWPRWAQQAQSWSGPVSVAVYIPAPHGSAAAAACVQLALQLAQEFEQKHPMQPLVLSVLYACAFVREGIAALQQAGLAADHPLLLPNPPPYSPGYDQLYPINALRNLALQQATTPLVLLADGDSIFSYNLLQQLSEPWVQQLLQLGHHQHHQAQQQEAQQHNLQEQHKTQQQQQHSGEDHQQQPDPQQEQQQQRPVMLVLPVFQLALQQELPDSQAAVVPRTKPDLARALAAGTVLPFHCGAFPPAQQPVDVDDWLTAREAYEVQYCEFFEPQGVAQRQQLPAYDECFRGYGLNKVQHAWHMAQLGYRFMVLPDAFMVTAPHKRSASWRPTPGTATDAAHLSRIKQVYEQFKANWVLQQGATQ